MATLADAFVALRPDLSRFGPELRRGTEGPAGDAGRSAGQFFGRSFTSMLRAAAATGGALLAGVGLANLGRDAIKTAADLQQAQVAFTTLTGSAAQAQKFLADLKVFAAQTPFELPGLVDDARLLMGVGVAAKNVIPTLTAWGNAAGALGISGERFHRAMLALSQSLSAGTIKAGDMNQIIEAGIPIWKLMSEATGKPVTELKKLGEQGKLLSADILPKVQAQMNKDYGGAMVAQSKTLAGVWSTLMDTIHIGLADALEPLIPVLSKAIPKAAEFLSKALATGSRAATDFVTKYGPSFKRVITDNVITPLRDFVTQHGDRIKQFFTDLFDRFKQVDVDKLARTAAQVALLAGVFTSVKAVANHPILTLLGVLAARYPKETADFLGSVSDTLVGAMRFAASNREAVKLIVELLAAYKGLQLLRGLKLPDLFSGAQQAATTQAGAGGEMLQAARLQLAAAADMLLAARTQVGAAAGGAAGAGAGGAAGALASSQGLKTAAVGAATRFSAYFIAALNAISFGESIVNVIKRGFTGFDVANLITGGLLGNVVDTSALIVKLLGMDPAKVDKIKADLKANFFGQIASFLGTELPNFISQYLAGGIPVGGGWSGLGHLLIDGLKNGIGDALSGIDAWVGEKVNGVINAFKRWLGIASPSTVFYSIGSDVVAGFLNGLAASWPGVSNWFGGLLARARAAIGLPYLWAYGIAFDIINGLRGGLQSAWGPVMSWFASIPGWVKNALGIHSPPAWAVDAGSWIMKGLIQGLTGGYDLTHFVGHFTELAKKKLMSMFGTGAAGGNLLGWIQAAMSITGVPGSWLQPLITLIMRESGGNPNAINRTDINAQRGDPSRGLMQTIGATFNRYRLPGLSSNIYDPISNIVAGIRYILARYGSIFNVQQANAQLPPRGYATGAWRIANDQLAYLHRDEMVVPAGPAEEVRRRAGADDPNTELLRDIRELLRRIAESPAAGMFGLGRTADLFARGG